MSRTKRQTKLFELRAMPLDLYVRTHMPNGMDNGDWSFEAIDEKPSTDDLPAGWFVYQWSGDDPPSSGKGIPVGELPDHLAVEEDDNLAQWVVTREDAREIRRLRDEYDRAKYAFKDWFRFPKGTYPK